jgi:hypothetical protein
MARVQFVTRVYPPDVPLVAGNAPVGPADAPAADPTRRNPWLYTPCALGIIAVGYGFLYVMACPARASQVVLCGWLAFAAGCQIHLLVRR